MNFLRLLALFFAVGCLGGKTSKDETLNLKGPKGRSLNHERNESKSRIGKFGKYIGAGALGLVSFWIATSFQKNGNIVNVDLEPDKYNSNLNVFEGVLNNENMLEISKRNLKKEEDGEGVLGKIGYSISNERFFSSGFELAPVDIYGGEESYLIHKVPLPVTLEKFYSDFHFLRSPASSNPALRFSGEDNASFRAMVPFKTDEVATVNCRAEKNRCILDLSVTTFGGLKEASKRDFSATIEDSFCDKYSYVDLVRSEKYGLMTVLKNSEDKVYLFTLDLEQPNPFLSTRVLDYMGLIYSIKLIEEKYLLIGGYLESNLLTLIDLDSFAKVDEISDNEMYLLSLGVGAAAVRDSKYVYPMGVQEGKIKINLESPVENINLPLIRGTKDGSIIELFSGDKGISWKLRNARLQLIDEGEIWEQDFANKDLGKSCSNNCLEWECLKDSTSCLFMYDKNGEKYVRELFLNQKKTLF